MNTTANEMSTTHQVQRSNHQTSTRNFKLDATLVLPGSRDFEGFPQWVGGRCCDDMLRFAGAGVVEPQLPGVQVDTPIWVSTAEAIFSVASDGATNMGKLGPYLVVPPGLQVDLQQEITITFTYYAVIKASFDGFGFGLIQYFRLVFALLFAEVMDQLSFLGWRLLSDDR